MTWPRGKRACARFSRSGYAGRIVERCDVNWLSHGDPDAAIATIDGLIDGLAGSTASRRARASRCVPPVRASGAGTG
jgi:hypothetical protein